MGKHFRILRAVRWEEHTGSRLKISTLLACDADFRDGLFEHLIV
jgi:hypothetical protein